MDTKVWTMTLAAWAGISFVLCVGWCAVAPEGWHARALLELALPGFTWLSPASFLLGLVESAAVGAYSGATISVLHNWLSSSVSHAPVAAKAAA